MAATAEVLKQIFYEVVGRGLTERIFGFFGRSSTPPASTSAQGAAAASAEVNLTEEASVEFAAVLHGVPGIGDNAFKNFVAAHDALLPPQQNRLERAFGKLVSKLKTGIFPEGVEKIVETERVAGSDKTVTRTQEKTLYKDGWSPGEILVADINRAGETTEGVRKFTEWLVQDTLWKKGTTELIAFAKEAKRVAWWAVIITTVTYFVALWYFGTRGWGGLLKALENPEAPLYAPMCYFGVFLFLLWIPIKGALPTPMEKNVLRIGGAAGLTYLVILVMKYFGVYTGFLPNSVLILIVLTTFADTFGKGGARLQKYLGAATVVLILLALPFTRPTTQWVIGTIERWMPRDNFDTATGAPRVKVRDGEVGGEPMPESHNYDPKTGQKLRLITTQDVVEKEEGTRQPRTTTTEVLTPRSSVYAFVVGAGTWGPVITAPGASGFGLVITDGCGVVVIQGSYKQYRLENVCPGDKRLKDPRPTDRSLMGRDEAVLSYQIQGGKIVGLAESTWP